MLWHAGWVLTQTKPERPRGRPKASDSVPIEEILGKALTMFATVGYDGVSLRTLNRELGVSHNLIYQRFGGKDDLWRASVDFRFRPPPPLLQGVFYSTPTQPLGQLCPSVPRHIPFSPRPPQLACVDYN